MINAGLSPVSSRSESQKTTSSASSTSSKISSLFNHRRLSHKRLDPKASTTTLTSSSLSFAEELDYDNMAWGSKSRK